MATDTEQDQLACTHVHIRGENVHLLGRRDVPVTWPADPADRDQHERERERERVRMDGRPLRRAAQLARGAHTWRARAPGPATL